MSENALKLTFMAMDLNELKLAYVPKEGKGDGDWIDDMSQHLIYSSHKIVEKFKFRGERVPGGGLNGLDNAPSLTSFWFWKLP